MDVTRHDADLDFVRGDQTRAIGSEQQRLLAASRFFGTHAVAHFQHVPNRDAFGDTDRQIEVCFNSFPDGGCSASWRNINDRNGRPGFRSSFLDRSVNWNVEDGLTSLLRVHAGYKTVFAVCVFLTLFSVELTRLTGDTLGNDLGVFVDEDGHVFS